MREPGRASIRGRKTLIPCLHPNGTDSWRDRTTETMLQGVGMALKLSMALTAHSVPAGKRLQNETGVLGDHYDRENKRKRYPNPLLRHRFGNSTWGQGSGGEDQHHKGWLKNIVARSPLPIQVQAKADSPHPPSVPLTQHHPSPGSPGFSTSKMA